MKKKTLVILLIVPFIVGLLTFISVKVMKNFVSVDILGISLPYNETEGFKLDGDNKYELKATVNKDESNEKSLIDGADKLYWYSDTNEYLSILNEDDKYYLKPLKVNDADTKVKVYCANVINTKVVSFNAIIYKDGTILINPLKKGSGSNIDSNKYYGEYDLKYDLPLKKDSYSKELASFKVTHEVKSDITNSNEVYLKESSSNVTYENDMIYILDGGEAYFTLASKEANYISSTYRFNIIKDGVNIYSYNDLMMATNFSTNGEKVVLQTNLESIKNTYKKDGDNYTDQLIDESTQLFGNYDLNTKKYGFNDELYSHKTTYLKDFIEQYNKENNEDNTINLLSGIRVQKDFYGNGFTINLDNLAYPHNGKIDNTTGKLAPTSDDYFFGPLALVTIGDLKTPIVKAFAQDNSGIYIDGDNITINDLKVMNVSEQTNTYDYSFTGSVVDVNGKNNTIKNSIISNGRTIVRAFSSDNLTIDNCILKNAGEFILKLGSDKVNTYNKNQKLSFDYNDTTFTDTFTHFFDTKMADAGSSIVADSVATGIIMSDETNGLYKKALYAMQSYLDNTSGIINSDGSINYDSNITVKDTYFSNSGIFSIAFETAFNGIYLYNGMPSFIKQTLSSLVTPNEVGRTSYPVKLTLEGDTRFYDYKNIDKIDTTSLIEERISSTFNRPDLSIDDYFPMKYILKDYAIKNNYVYAKDSINYLNTQVAYYGGGLNLSTLVNNITGNRNTFSDKIEVDVASAALDETYTSSASGLIKKLSKCVIFASGTNPFNFIINGKQTGETPELFNKLPDINDLIARA